MPAVRTRRCKPGKCVCKKYQCSARLLRNDPLPVRSSSTDPAAFKNSSEYLENTLSELEVSKLSPLFQKDYREKHGSRDYQHSQGPSDHLHPRPQQQYGLVLNGGAYQDPSRGLIQEQPLQRGQYAAQHGGYPGPGLSEPCPPPPPPTNAPWPHPNFAPQHGGYGAQGDPLYCLPTTTSAGQNAGWVGTTLPSSTSAATPALDPPLHITFDPSTEQQLEHSLQTLLQPFPQPQLPSDASTHAPPQMSISMGASVHAQYLPVQQLLPQQPVSHPQMPSDASAPHYQQQPLLLQVSPLPSMPPPCPPAQQSSSGPSLEPPSLEPPSQPPSQPASQPQAPSDANTYQQHHVDPGGGADPQEPPALDDTSESLLQLLMSSEGSGWPEMGEVEEWSQVLGQHEDQGWDWSRDWDQDGGLVGGQEVQSG